MTDGRRLRLVLVLAVLTTGGLALLAWTQVWIRVQVDAGGADMRTLEVPGSIAAPALSALALAGLALGGALSIAGPVIRSVLAILEVLLGVSVAVASVPALAEPAGASAAAVTAATGIAGADSAVRDVAGTTLTAWPLVAVTAGVLMSAAGVAVLATVRRWPGPTHRYQAVRFEGATKPPRRPEGDAIGDWDELSRGEDPTA